MLHTEILVLKKIKSYATAPQKYLRQNTETNSCDSQPLGIHIKKPGVTHSHKAARAGEWDLLCGAESTG